MDSAPVVNWAILKIAQRCNINCTYCYVYNRGDTSWQDRPAVMSDEIVLAVGQRIRRQAEEFGLAEFHVELHGGEPLLVGRRRFEAICTTLKENAGVDLRFHMQTNGLLLDRSWLELLDRLDVSFGISLDGPPALHDRNRVDHFERGKGDRLISILHDLSAERSFHRLFGGILCVVSTPLPHGGELLDWFVRNGVRDIDFLMPDGNHANLPGRDFDPADFARFWIEVYGKWSSYGRSAPRIRTLRTLLRGLVGERSGMDAHGGDLRTMLVVETDGSIGISDVGRICPPLNEDVHHVLTHAFRAHQEREDIALMQRLPAKCIDCRWLPACGGGYLPHRFTGEDFSQPSIYCDVWDALLERMAGEIATELERNNVGPRFSASRTAHRPAA
nr:radical SAM protein [Mesorhizobium sp.]